jgi:hypothetical protein
MEQHPVPQNVTSFQFQLFGNMTMKQFGYLIVFALIAAVFYNLPVPKFLTLPLAVAAALLGFGFAFVPIEERPMDVWVFAFLKSVFSPTQYVWQRTPATVKPDQPSVLHNQPVGNTKPQEKNFFSALVDLIAPVHKPPNTKAASPPPAPAAPPAPPIPKPTPEPVRPVSTPSIVGTPVTPPKNEPEKPAVVAPVTPAPAPAEVTKIKELENKLQALETALSKKNEEAKRITELQSQLTAVLSEREKMDAELAALRNKIKQAGTNSAPTRSAGVIAGGNNQPTIKVISADSAVKSGLPRLTTFPNVVTGIIKDHLNNLLPGVLVTVKDREGMPVRALKTNKLGQFAASTPLPNNTYFVEVEDPKNAFIFDRIQITLTGGVVPPIEVVAKSERELNRRKLEDQIFGNHQ